MVGVEDVRNKLADIFNSSYYNRDIPDTPYKIQSIFPVGTDDQICVLLHDEENSSHAFYLLTVVEAYLELV